MVRVFGRLENRIWNEIKADIHRLERMTGILRAQRGKADMNKNYNPEKFKFFRKLHKKPPVAKNISYEYLREYENNSEVKLCRLYNQMRFTHLGINRDDLTPKKGR